MTQPQAGWYPDPSGDPRKLRYWDGAQWTNDYSYTPESGAAAQAQPVVQQAQPVVNQAIAATQTGDPKAIYQVDSQDSTLRLIAFIFSIVSCVAMGWMIFPLAWCIPMTVHSYGIYKGRKANSVAFGVCMLIFVSLVSGILLLISKKEK